MRKKGNDRYRQCASVAVFRPADVCSPDGCDTLYEVLLVHKPRKKDAWQLPQGGMESGESVEDAALRELREEAGITATLIGGCPHVYQYDFPASYRRFRPDNICGQQVHYVVATAEKDVKVMVDGREIDSFTWVLPEQLPKYLKRKEYLKLVTRLCGEAMEQLRGGTAG